MWLSRKDTILSGLCWCSNEEDCAKTWKDRHVNPFSFWDWDRVSRSSSKGCQPWSANCLKTWRMVQFMDENSTCAKNFGHLHELLKLFFWRNVSFRLNNASTCECVEWGHCHRYRSRTRMMLNESHANKK